FNGLSTFDFGAMKRLDILKEMDNALNLEDTITEMVLHYKRIHKQKEIVIICSEIIAKQFKTHSPPSTEIYALPASNTHNTLWTLHMRLYNNENRGSAPAMQQPYHALTRAVGLMNLFFYYLAEKRSNMRDFLFNTLVNKKE